MSTAASPAAAAPAAAPAGGAPPAAPAAAPAAPETLKTVPADIRRRALNGDLPKPAAADPAATPAAAPAAPATPAAPAPAPADPAAPAAPASAPAAEPEGVRKIKAGPALPTAAPAAVDDAAVRRAVESVLPGITKDNTPATPSLTQEQQREVDLAKFAETKNPEMYTGFAERVASFYPKVDLHLSEKAKELGGENSDEFKDYRESEDFSKWIRDNRPSYRRGDRERFHEDMIADRARNETRKELEPKLNELRRETAELKHGPEIRGKVDKLRTAMIVDPSPPAEQEPALVEYAKNPAEFAKNHPGEAKEIEETVAVFSAAAEEVYRVDMDLVPIDKVKRPIQKFIGNFIAERNEQLRAKHPTGVEMNDGTILIDDATLEDLRARKVPGIEKYRTFTGDEVAGMIAMTGMSEVKMRLKKRRESFESSFFKKKGGDAPASPPQAAREDPEPASPAAGASPAPGAPARAPEKPKSLARKYA